MKSYINVVVLVVLVVSITGCKPKEENSFKELSADIVAIEKATDSLLQIESEESPTTSELIAQTEMKISIKKALIETGEKILQKALDNMDTNSKLMSSEESKSLVLLHAEVSEDLRSFKESLKEDEEILETLKGFKKMEVALEEQSQELSRIIENSEESLRNIQEFAEISILDMQ